MSQLILIRFDDLSFLRNMAQRAKLTHRDARQYNEVMDRVMTAQQKYLNERPELRAHNVACGQPFFSEGNMCMRCGLERDCHGEPAP